MNAKGANAFAQSVSVESIPAFKARDRRYSACFLPPTRGNGERR